MKKCADGFWQMRKISPKRNWRSIGEKQTFHNGELEHCLADIIKYLKECGA